DPRQRLMAVAAARQARSGRRYPVPAAAVRARDDFSGRCWGGHGSGGVLVGGILVADGKLAGGVSDADDRAVEDVAGKQGAPDPGLDLPADEPAQRPRAVDRVEALLGDEAARLVADLQRHPAIADP